MIGLLSESPLQGSTSIHLAGVSPSGTVGQSYLLVAAASDLLWTVPRNVVEDLVYVLMIIVVFALFLYGSKKYGTAISWSGFLAAVGWLALKRWLQFCALGKKGKSGWLEAVEFRVFSVQVLQVWLHS